jgi:hypothetical protein
MGKRFVVIWLVMFFFKFIFSAGAAGTMRRDDCMDELSGATKNVFRWG